MWPRDNRWVVAINTAFGDGAGQPPISLFGNLSQLDSLEEE
jgi:hypothetical protein